MLCFVDGNHTTEKWEDSEKGTSSWGQAPQLMGGVVFDSKLPALPLAWWS